MGRRLSFWALAIGILLGACSDARESAAPAGPSVGALFRGSQTMDMDEATMVEAVQEYVDRRFVGVHHVKVAGVTFERGPSGAPSGNGVFHVSVTALEANSSSAPVDQEILHLRELDGQR